MSCAVRGNRHNCQEDTQYSPPLSLSLSLSLSLPPSLSPPPLCVSLFLSLSLSLSPSLSFTHTHTHSLSLSVCLSIPISRLGLSVSLLLYFASRIQACIHTKLFTVLRMHTIDSFVPSMWYSMMFVCRKKEANILPPCTDTYRIHLYACVVTYPSHAMTRSSSRFSTWSIHDPATNAADRSVHEHMLEIRWRTHKL
jgi:hypothetical protein